MINLLILVAVIVAFAKAATTHKRNPLAWGLIGGVSYIVPSSIVFELVIKKMLAGGPGAMPSHASMILLTGTGILAGLICCFAAYKFLSNGSTNQA